MKDGSRSLRRAVWWSIGSRVSLVLVLVLALCSSAGIRVASPVRLALELTTAIPLLILAARLAMAYRRHRHEGSRRLAALHAVYADRAGSWSTRSACSPARCAELSQGGQTTVTVQLTRPVTFTRPLGKTACARAFRFYAADPAAAVAAIRARVPGLQTTPSR